MEGEMFGANVEICVSDKSLEWITPLLAKWLKINRDYIEENDCKDCLYWYNERASISTFAGA
jgi:hypothetical protein